MIIHLKILLSGILLSVLLVGCATDEIDANEYANIEVTELKTFESYRTNEALLLGVPVRIKHDYNTQHLFVQDVANWAIIELDEQRNEVRRYGKQGRGPGEVQSLDDFFISKEHLFIVDGNQFLIHKYTLNDGQFISSFDYAGFLMARENRTENGVLLPPPAALNDNNNRPFVTQNETILLPSQSNSEFLYQAINWHGEKIGSIREIPAGFNALGNDDKVSAAIEDREVPPRDSALVFPVNDLSNYDEIFLVYSAIPKIAKYDLSGNKIWEKNIPNTTEVDSLMIDLSNALLDDPKKRASLLPVKKYMVGRGSLDGSLFLFTYTNMDTPGTPRRPMWMHQFNPRGSMVHRYKINFDVDQFYYPGIDFNKRIIFTPSFKESDIRTYTF